MGLVTPANDGDARSSDDDGGKIAEDSHQPTEALVEGSAEHSRCGRVDAERGEHRDRYKKQTNEVGAAPVERLGQGALCVLPCWFLAICGALASVCGSASTACLCTAGRRTSGR